jgi:hypothetical protein
MDRMQAAGAGRERGLFVRAGSASESERRTTAGRSGHERVRRNRCAYSLLTLGRGEGRNAVPSLPTDCREPSGLLPTRQWSPGRASPNGYGEPTARPGYRHHPRPPCHKCAIHSGPDRSRADNHGQQRSSLDLRRSPPSQVTAAAELALGAGGRRFKSGRPDHQHESPAQQGYRRSLTRLTGACCT